MNKTNLFLYIQKTKETVIENFLNYFYQIIPYMVTYVTTCSMSIVVWKVQVVQEIFI